MVTSDDAPADPDLAGQKPAPCECDFYYEQGLMQLIARSKHFSVAFFAFTCFYLIWLSVDVDMNAATRLFDAEPTFIAVTLLFTIFFTFNIVVRFCAFKNKGLFFQRCLGDFILWVFLIINYNNSVNFTAVQLLRVFSLARLVPELSILWKGLWCATRSMFYVLLSLVLDIYVFAILFRMLTEDTDVGRNYFETVSDAMYSLMLRGMLFQGMGDLIEEFEKPITKAFFLLYLFTALVLLVLLFGVMLEIVSVVAKEEKEKLLAQYTNTSSNAPLPGSDDIPARLARIELRLNDVAELGNLRE